MRNEVIFDSRGIPDIMVVFTPDELGLPAEIRGKAVKAADVLPDIAAHVGDSLGRVVVVPCHRAGAGQGFAVPAAVSVCSAGFLRVAVALSAVSVSAGEGAVLAALVCQPFSHSCPAHNRRTV